MQRTVSWACSLRPSPPAFPKLEGDEIALIDMSDLRRLDSKMGLARVVNSLRNAHVTAIAVLGPVEDAAIQAAKANRVALLQLSNAEPLVQVERAVIRLIVDRAGYIAQRAAELSGTLTSRTDQIATALSDHGQAISQTLSDRAAQITEVWRASASSVEEALSARVGQVGDAMSAKAIEIATALAARAEELGRLWADRAGQIDLTLGEKADGIAATLDARARTMSIRSSAS